MSPSPPRKTVTGYALLTNRLGRVQARIRALSLFTKEDYVAQLTSLVNGVINQDYAMQDLITISPGTPGVVGDPVTNMLRLNDDCGDMADEIGRLENNASVLYNLVPSRRHIQNSRARGNGAVSRLPLA
jgi:hypothetical protein